MKPVFLFSFFAILCIMLVPASADTEIRPTVSVTYTVDPVVLLPGDSGTITFELKNMASGEVYVEEDDETFDMNAYVASATLKGEDSVKSGGTTFTDVGLLGPGDSITFTFNIRASANASSGTHYLNLEIVGGSDMQDLNYKVPVKVDSRKVDLIIADFPATTINEISTVSVDVVNPLSGSVTGVIVIPKGNDVGFTPSEYFVGNIEGGNSSAVSLTLNTMQSSEGVKDISFDVFYYNGDNLHTFTEDTTLEIVERSSLIFTNLEITRFGNSYLFTGDLNNFGTTSAQNVILSIYPEEGIEPVQPSGSYFIGTLEADDFSGFELSALVTGDNVTEIPVLIEFRDSGNTYASAIENLPLESGRVSSSSSESGIPVYVWAIILLSTGVIGFVIYRSWKSSKEPDSQVVNDEQDS
ncbi:hypothetical protein J2755_002251 [Methanohalophilus levihalophilus]|uniref:COG1361 S-layer family protein n=1 Tax=Methanohalophilus levihalophilus TaxID=1431282 RepID=UPI001AEB939C|nr:hypothetical protein [Methanohalophilus levihalophilus]MBP2031288.1 hypothetical protein [Methanohalophilus levihalophilus]